SASRTIPMLRIVARLRPGVRVDDARRELVAIAAEQTQAHPETNRFRGADVVSMREQVTGDARPALLVLFGAVGFVLLLARANIAGLALARTAARGREIAIRTALGARRGRILRQLLTESVLLALVGGGLGLLLALWGTEILVSFFPKSVHNLNIPI